MKITNLINFAHIVAGINSMPKITNLHKVKNHNSSSINTAITFDTYPKHSSNINYLKPFDTAFIAYYMMGLGNF
ncbi:hypothetical protein [Nostoc sp.]|uniref:hypothetical protein n=1 Tax=Nostoc sp. TaxID=1180 RepID=UPI002FF7CA33